MLLDYTLCKPFLLMIFTMTQFIDDFNGCLHFILAYIILMKVGLCDLGVTCSPRHPMFAGSNPTEVDGFFRDVKILSTSPPEGL